MVHEKQATAFEKRAPMIRAQSHRQLSLAEFEWPFKTSLDENRWVKLGDCIPWDELAEAYYEGLFRTQGRPTKDARLFIGAVIIKHKLNLSDRETVAQIQENPYLQYFVGLPGYQMEAILGDTIYCSRDNRRHLKGRGIRFAGKPFGRPKKVTEENPEELKCEAAQRREEYLQRISIEGKFGQGKNGYRLNYIRAKRADTSAAWINGVFLVMNLLEVACWLVRKVRAGARYGLLTLAEKVVLYWRTGVLCRMGRAWSNSAMAAF